MIVRELVEKLMAFDPSMEVQICTLNDQTGISKLEVSTQETPDPETGEYEEICVIFSNEPG